MRADTLPPRLPLRGISLVELMVALAVGLLISLAAVSSLNVFSNGQRQGTATGSTMLNAVSVLSAIKSDVAVAGLGFFDGRRPLCDRLNLSVGPTLVMNGADFAPLRIVRALGNDQLDVIHGSTLAKMGYLYGRPLIARTASRDVVLVTSGYDNAQTIGDGKGRMWMLDPSTGAILTEFVTTYGSNGAEAGLIHVSAFREKDVTVRHVYGGDLLGNLWHFDLSTGATTRLAVLKDAAGDVQPITAAPELVMMADKRLVLIGTGRLLDVSDFGSSRTQSFYAIIDGDELPNARNGLTARTYSRGSSPEISGVSIDWTTDRGWYFDLPAGEQANTQPTVAFGMVGFTTNLNGGTDCNQTAYMYLVDIGTGLKSAYADFSSTPISTTANSSRLSVLRVVSGQLVGTSHTTDNRVYRRVLGNAAPIPAAKNAWREIRR